MQDQPGTSRVAGKGKLGLCGFSCRVSEAAYSPLPPVQAKVGGPSRNKLFGAGDVALKILS